MKEYNDALDRVITLGQVVGNTKEILNMNLKLPTNELCTSKRRPMSPYYLVGELMFNLAYSNDVKFIGHYAKMWYDITDGEKVRSAYWWQAKYGHEIDQILFVINKLRADKNTRQAVIHLKHVNILPTRDEICTLNLQFFIRKNRLEMIVNMRSNDIIRGLPYDHAMFVMLQAFIANELQMKIGEFYYHNAASFHLYDSDEITNDSTLVSYPIEFTDEFFRQKHNLLLLEKACRNDNISLEMGINLIRNNIEGDLAKAVAAILLMYKRPPEEKEMIMKKVLRYNYSGLKQLLVDYHNFLRRKK